MINLHMNKHLGCCLIKRFIFVAIQQLGWGTSFYYVPKTTVGSSNNNIEKVPALGQLIYNLATFFFFTNIHSPLFCWPPAVFCCFSSCFPLLLDIFLCSSCLKKQFLPVIPWIYNSPFFQFWFQSQFQKCQN